MIKERIKIIWRITIKEIIKIIWRITIFFPHVIQWGCSCLIGVIYLFGIIYPLYKLANPDFIEIILILFSVFGSLYSIWMNVKHGTHIAKGLIYFPIKLFVPIVNSVKLFTSLLLSIIEILFSLIFNSIGRVLSFHEQDKIWSFFSPIKSSIPKLIDSSRILLRLFVNKYKYIFLCTFIFFSLSTILFTNKTFDDSLLHINDLQKDLTNIYTQIESIESWLDETKNSLSETENDINLLSTKFNQFYTKPYSLELPKDVRGKKALDTNYKDFLNTLKSIQTNLDKTKHELLQKQKIFNSIKNDIPNIIVRLKTECKKNQHNKGNISNRIEKCRSLENQFYNIERQLNSNSIPLSLSRIFNTYKKNYEQLIVPQEIRETWSREITKIQVDLDIFPTQLNNSFIEADNLVEDAKSNKVQIQNELSKIIDKLSEQKSQFIEFRKIYNKEKNELNNTTSTNYTSNLNEQLSIAQNKHYKLAKLAKDHQLIIDTTKDLQSRINKTYDIEDQIKELENIQKNIKNLKVSLSYKNVIQNKLLILNKVLDESKALINRAKDIDNQIKTFIADLNNDSKEVNNFIKRSLLDLDREIKDINLKLIIRSLIIIIVILFLGIGLWILRRYLKEKKDVDKLDSIEKATNSIDKFSKYIEIIESTSRLYTTRQEALNKAENIINDELQKCRENILIIPNQTVETDIENIRIKINILRDSVRKLERIKYPEEGDIKIRNELLSKINALELQLSELRDISD